MDMEGSTHIPFLSPDAVIRAAKFEHGMQVADMHAGAGFFARAAARAVGSRGRVWAVDSDRGRLLRLKNHAAMEGLENIEIVRGNAESKLGTLLPEGGMDAVILAAALFGAQDRDGMLQEAGRVLSGSGKLILVEWLETAPMLGAARPHALPRLDGLRLLADNEFVPTRELLAGTYHWGAVFHKKSDI